MAKNNGNGLRILVTLLITFICLMLSFVNVADAYRDITRGSYFFSGLLSLAIVAVLFMCAVGIHQARTNRESVWTPLLVYLLFVLFSFAGNFNGFYSFFMRGELLKTELTEKYDVLNKLREDARVALGNYKDRTPEVNQLSSQLESQIRNPSEPGCGPKCEEKLVELEALLGTKITRLKAADKEFLIREYKKMVEDARKAQLEQLNSAEQKGIISQLDQDIETLRPEVSAAMQEPATKALPLITTIVEKYKFYGQKVKSFVGKTFVYVEDINVRNAEIGKMSHTFSSAKDHLDHSGTWIAAMVAVLIDLIVPIVVIVMSKPGDKVRSRGSKGSTNLTEK